MYADRHDVSRSRAEVDYLERSLGLSPGAHVLDAPCGHGRHLVELASRGYAVVGVDLDEHALTLAREAIASRELPPGRARVLRGELREMSFVEEFDAAYNYFTSFGYFESEEEDERALRAIARALKPGGAFVLETMNLYHLAQVFRPYDWQELSSGSSMMIERSWDITTGRLLERRVFRDPNGTESEVLADLRLYSATELRAMCYRVGLEVQAMHSAPFGGPCSLESSRLAIVARKVASDPSGPAPV